LLANNDQELAYYCARLAYDEDYRLGLVMSARRRLETELANPRQIEAGWWRLFATLNRSAPCP